MVISFTTTTVTVMIVLKKPAKSCSNAVYYKPLQLLYMATVNLCSMCYHHTSNAKLRTRDSDLCPYCDVLRSELHKAHLEILSYVTVINVLQEDLYKLRTHPDCVKVIFTMNNFNTRNHRTTGYMLHHTHK